MMILSEIKNSISQILLFSLIPIIIYLIKQNTLKGFFVYVGLKKSINKANLYAVLTSILFSGSLLLLAIFNDEFREIVHSPSSSTGGFKELGFSFSSVVILLIAAIFKTALAEEIFFRGFVAKRLISVLGYQKGNVLQALIFGVIHTAIFALVTSNILFLAVIFIVPSIGSYVSVYLNEMLADGSIIPGWISHALGNIVSYTIVGFLT